MTDQGATPENRSVPGDPPFPKSLCYLCAAPIKLIRTARSTFLYCPIFKRYPPQPVLACEKFVPKTDSSNAAGNG